MTSRYLNQWWLIVNFIIGNKFQWNFNQNASIFTRENRLENIVCKMASILFLCQLVASGQQPPSRQPRTSLTNTISWVLGAMSPRRGPPTDHPLCPFRRISPDQNWAFNSAIPPGGNNTLPLELDCRSDSMRECHANGAKAKMWKFVLRLVLL